jgi:hypothetical protein
MCDENAPGTQIKRTDAFDYPGMVKSNFKGVTSKINKYNYTRGRPVDSAYY